MYLQNVLKLLGFTFTVFGITELLISRVLITRGIQKIMHPHLYLNAKYDIEVKQNTKCSSEYVPCFCTSSFYIVSLSFDTVPPAVNRFY
jgi:hypothetical protein